MLTAGWQHGLDGRESEWTPGVGDEQGGLECCDSWGRKESDTTELLNWTEMLTDCFGTIISGILAQEWYQCQSLPSLFLMMTICRCVLFNPITRVQLWLALCDPKDCSPPGSSVKGIFQARILDGLPCPPPGNLPDPGIKSTYLVSPALAGGFFVSI